MVPLAKSLLLLLIVATSISFASADLVIVSVTGNSELVVGSEQEYIVELKNTGEMQKETSVVAYNYKLKIQEMTDDFDIDSGETKQVTLKIVTPEYVGSENLLFIAMNDYTESSVKELRIDVRENAEDFTTEQPSDNPTIQTPDEPKSWFSYWMLIIPIILIVIFILYRRQDRK